MHKLYCAPTLLRSQHAYSSSANLMILSGLPKQSFRLLVISQLKLLFILHLLVSQSPKIKGDPDQTGSYYIGQVGQCLAVSSEAGQHVGRFGTFMLTNQKNW
jgi:hypothetical protein